MLLLIGTSTEAFLFLAGCGSHVGTGPRKQLFWVPVLFEALSSARHGQRDAHAAELKASTGGTQKNWHGSLISASRNN